MDLLPRTRAGLHHARSRPELTRPPAPKIDAPIRALYAPRPQPGALRAAKRPAVTDWP
jgi:hypothetical protein